MNQSTFAATSSANSSDQKRKPASSEEQNQKEMYDTVTSVHDIEQDSHHYYDAGSLPVPSSKLSKIIEVPSTNITRKNSLSDLEHANTKVWIELAPPIQQTKPNYHQMHALKSLFLQWWNSKNPFKQILFQFLLLTSLLSILNIVFFVCIFFFVKIFCFSID